MELLLLESPETGFVLVGVAVATVVVDVGRLSTAGKERSPALSFIASSYLGGGQLEAKYEGGGSLANSELISGSTMKRVLGRAAPGV